MTKVTSLILAASRAGAEDAVAQLQGVSHKCLVDLDGTVMLERVVNAIRASDHVDQIYVSIESEDILNATPGLKAMFADGTIRFTPSQGNLFQSVKHAAANIENPYPLVISTGDNALHTTEMIDHFCHELLASGHDVGVGMTPASTILEAYPDGKRAFHELRDGGWSSCNIYGLSSANAARIAKVFESGGQFGKRPQRILEAFGLSFLIKYKFKLATLDQLAEHLSKRWKARVHPIRMPFADAPIDVDNPGDFHRTESILKARRAAEA